MKGFMFFAAIAVALSCARIKKQPDIFNITLDDYCHKLNDFTSLYFPETAQPLNMKTVKIGMPRKIKKKLRRGLGKPGLVFIQVLRFWNIIDLQPKSCRKPNSEEKWKIKCSQLQDISSDLHDLLNTLVSKKLPKVVSGRKKMNKLLIKLGIQKKVPNKKKIFKKFPITLESINNVGKELSAYCKVKK